MRPPSLFVCGIRISSNFIVDPDAHGAKRVTGVDINEDAVLNAQENRALLGKNESELAFVRADLFPAATDSDAKYDLLVCNPPWLPMPVETAEACPHNPGTDGLMGGVLDRRGDLLPALFRGLTDRLSSRGRLWLIYSDLSIKLGLQDEVNRPSLNHNAEFFNLLTCSYCCSRGSSISARPMGSWCALRPACRHECAFTRKIRSINSRKGKCSPCTRLCRNTERTARVC